MAKSKKVTYTQWTSTIFINTPYVITDARYERFIAALKNERKYGENIRWIESIMTYGDYLYSCENDKLKTRELRLEIDNRFITNEEACQLLEQVFEDIKNK